MRIAMAYEVEDMIRVCEEQICRSLTYETACDALVMADSLPTSTLAERIIAFILANPKEVFLASSFKLFFKSHNELALQITQRVSQLLP